MRVTYDNEKNVFFIDLNGFQDLAYVRSLPTRRFQEKTKKWIAPAIRINALEILKFPRLEMTTEAREKAENLVNGIKIDKKPFPRDFKFKTKPLWYQEKTLDLIHSLPYAGLAYDPGTGKTKISLDKAGILYFEGKINFLLVICKKSTRTEWMTQIEEHCAVEHRAALLDLSSARKVREMEDFVKYPGKGLRILVVGTETLSNSKTTTEFLERAIASRGNRTMVVLDESHLIKTPGSSRTKATLDISKNTVFRVFLTGTPVSQGVQDFYSQIQFLSPDILGVGDYWSFKSRYLVMGGYENKRIVGTRNMEEFMEQVAPYIFQMRASEAVDLPEQVFKVRKVELSKTHRAFYDKLKKERVAELPDTEDEMLHVKNILTLYGALQQICSGFITVSDGPECRVTQQLVDPKSNPKVQEILDIIEELPDDEQVIIWCKYTYEVEMLAALLRGNMTSKFESSEPVRFTGAFTEEEKEKGKQLFLAKKCRYFISTQQSGGTGLTLNTARYVVYFSNTFDLLHREQSLKRNHRIGQTRGVVYFDIVVENSIEEEILDALMTKKSMSDYILEQIKGAKENEK